MPRYQERDFDVLAFKLPHDVPRPQAKTALLTRLIERGDVAGEIAGADTLSSVTDPILAALDGYRQKLRACNR